MADKAFSKMRGLSDEKLHGALTNHAGVLVHILNHINYNQKTAWRQKALNAVLVLGVLYSLHRPLVDGSVAQLTHYILGLF